MMPHLRPILQQQIAHAPKCPTMPQNKTIVSIARPAETDTIKSPRTNPISNAIHFARRNCVNSKAILPAHR